VGKSFGNNNNNTLKELWNSDAMKQLRVDLLAGVRNKHCTECYRLEDSGAQSSRIKYKNDMESDVMQHIVPRTTSDGTLEPFELQYVDMRFNNLCNFKCKPCNEFFSSQIATEKIKYKADPEYVLPWEGNTTLTTALVKNEKAFEEIKQHYPYINKIYFAGGEPMIQQEHWETLDDLVRLDLSKNIDLTYSTNGSNLSFKGKSVLEYWEKFKKVYLQFSIDAMGKQAEYWRDGTVWEEVDANIRLAKTCSTVEVSVHSTIAWPNVSSWISFVKYAVSDKLITNDNLTVWCLTTPTTYSLHVAPAFKKDQIRNELDELVIFLKNHENTDSIITKVETIKDFMDAETKNKYLINLRYAPRIDKVRKKNFLDYFPEHADMKDYFFP
jgi:organic radical activating enzyme